MHEVFSLGAERDGRRDGMLIGPDDADPVIAEREFRLRRAALLDHTAVAASMLQNGDAPEHVRTTLGLSEDELAEALQHVDLPVPAPAAPAAEDVEPREEAGPEPTGEPHTHADVPVADAAIEVLLIWGEQHDT
jgi:hypothetical protein